MSQTVSKPCHSISAEQTELIAERIGKQLRGGEVIELISDLGGGKTTFVRGLVRALGSTDKVASPTFTISKLYKTHRFEVHHFDFYRLSEPGMVAAELAELADDPATIVVVEWADAVQHVLPPERIAITIQQTATGDRELTLTVPLALAYLVEGL